MISIRFRKIFALVNLQKKHRYLSVWRCSERKYGPQKIRPSKTARIFVRPVFSEAHFFQDAQTNKYRKHKKEINFTDTCLTTLWCKFFWQKILWTFDKILLFKCSCLHIENHWFSRSWSTSGTDRSGRPQRELKSWFSGLVRTQSWKHRWKEATSLCSD